MKKLNEKELSKITGGFIGLGFDPTVSLYRKTKYNPFSVYLRSLLKSLRK